MARLSKVASRQVVRFPQLHGAPQIRTSQRAVASRMRCKIYITREDTELRTESLTCLRQNTVRPTAAAGRPET